MYKYNSYFECELCKNISDKEGGYKKEWENIELIPEEARKFENIPVPQGMGVLEKCPLCGTYYDYIQYYDYTPNGYDDEQHLIRLRSNEVIDFLIFIEQFSELEVFAKSTKKNAKLIMIEINRSKLNKNRPEFKKLVNVCREMLES